MYNINNYVNNNHLPIATTAMAVNNPKTIKKGATMSLATILNALYNEYCCDD